MKITFCTICGARMVLTPGDKRSVGRAWCRKCVRENLRYAFPIQMPIQMINIDMEWSC
jgi:hypothetical protein